MSILVSINNKLSKLGKYQVKPKDVVESCYETIKARIEDGWPDEELAKIISQMGVNIDGRTLRIHYNSISKMKRNSNTKEQINTEK